MKRLCLYLVVLLGGFLLIGAPGCTSDPNVEGAKLDIKNKDYDRAYENITKALETDPDNAEAHDLKGQILQEQAFATSDAAQHGALIQEMVASYNRSVELDPVHARAGAFLYGREDPIPAMFGTFVKHLHEAGSPCGVLRLYLERHVEADVQHRVLARYLLNRLCGGEASRWKEARAAAERALRARVELWGAVHRRLTSGIQTPDR